MNQNKETREVDAVQIISMLLKSWWVIVLAVVLCVGLAIGYTELYSVPTYSTSTTLLINGGGEGTSISSMAQQILLGQYQTKDYPYILNANDTMKEVAARLNAETGSSAYTAGSVGGRVAYESVEDSRIFRISVSGTNPEETRLVAETVSAVFIERVRLLAKVNVSVVDNPVTPVSPSSSGARRNAILGFAIGLVIGLGVAVLIGVSNDTIESEDWLINKYKEKIPLLSTVPDENAGARSSYYRYKYKYKYGANYAPINDKEDSE